MKTGDKIPVKINGQEIITVIDEDGVQRLPEDGYIRELVNCGVIDLNDLGIAVKVKKTCSEATRRWLYLRLGYSMCGYWEIFPHDDIENPLWEDETQAA